MTALQTQEWNEILGLVRKQYPDLVRHWFDRLSIQGLQHGVLDVRCQNGPQQRYLAEHCARPFAQAAQIQTGRLVSVRFSTQAPTATPPQEFAASWQDAIPSDPQPVSLNPAYTFDQFVTGPCNRLAHAACVSAGEAPGEAYNPLFVHGASGLGKTHLLQAVGHQVLQNAPNTKILYLSCENFINHFIEAVERGALHQFRFRYRHVDILLIDDIQFLAERERSQEEFFHTFNTLYQLRKQIVLSADCSPKEIPSLEDRLISRFSWGLVARIDPPCLETRMAIIRKKARLRGIDLSEDVVHFVAAKIEHNTRELEGAITMVDAFSQQLGRPIDMVVARQALGEIQELHRPARMTEIVDTVTEHFGVKRSDLQGKRRHKSIAFPRQVCMYLARELTPASLEEIGGFFGGRDHTTVLHATRLVSRMKQQDEALSEILNAMKNRIRHSARTEP